MPDERSLSSESGFSIIGAALARVALFLMPKRAGVAENAAAARRISGKIQEYLQERRKRNA